MLILAIDTALDACSAAVLEGDRVCASRRETMARGHQERLAPLVDAVMRDAGVAFAALDRIAVTRGPGSFTGLRVGLSFAKGLALGIARPLVGIGVLDALLAELETTPDLGSSLAVAVIDARHDRLHLQLLGRDPSSCTVDAAVEHVHAAAAGRPVIVTGPAAISLARRLADARVVARAAPDPVVVARLAARRATPDAAPSLLYLRAPDARTLAERGSEAPSPV